MIKNIDTKQAAQIAIRNRLYVPGWLMREHFGVALHYPENYDIHLYYDCSKPVAVFLRLKQNNHIMVFVKVAYRRKKIGSFLLEKFSKYGDFAKRGGDGSPTFFLKNNVKFMW